MLIHSLEADSEFETDCDSRGYWLTLWSWLVIWDWLRDRCWGTFRCWCWVQTVMLMLTHFLEAETEFDSTVMLMLMHFQMLKLSLTQMLDVGMYLWSRDWIWLQLCAHWSNLLSTFKKTFLKYSLKEMLRLPLIEKEKMKQPETDADSHLTCWYRLRLYCWSNFYDAFEMYLKMHSSYQLQGLDNLTTIKEVNGNRICLTCIRWECEGCIITQWF